MNTHQRQEMVEERMAAPAETSRSYSYWFAFTYLSPASLVGWEARMM